MRWLFVAPLMMAIVAAPLIMTGLANEEPSGFDLAFVLCTADADGQHITDDCMKVHISSPDGSQKLCIAKAPEIISDWMSQNAVHARAIAKWECMPQGTKLPDDQNSV